MSHRTVPCAGCRKQIMWKITPNDKRMPLNPEPLKEPVPGSYIVHEERCRPAQPMFDTEGPFYLNHWSDCPAANQFKPRKGSRS